MRRRLRIPKPPDHCYFCKESQEPEYKDAKILGKYLTSRGKLVGRSRNGLCQKHQRRLAVAVKRARHLAILPFETKLK